MNRWTTSLQRAAILPAAVVLQMCLGAVYAWAAFVGPLREATGIGQAAAQVPLAVFFYVFPLTMTLLATLPDRMPARVKAAAGGALFGAAWLMSGVEGAGVRWLTFWIGGVGGVGVGLAYLVPVSTAIAWFPKHKGLVAGIAVAGFGGGAALIGRLADHWMGACGWTPYEVFRALGAGFLFIVPLAGALLRRTPDLPPDPVARIPARRVLADPAFWILMASFGAGLSAGLSINGNLRHLGAAAGGAVSLVPLFAAGNAAGRIVWGAIADRTRPAVSLTAVLVLWTLVLAAGPALCAGMKGLQTFAVASGFAYGGGLVVHPAAIVGHWDRPAFTRVYGWLATVHVLAALAPPLAGRVYDRTGSFALPLVAMAGLTALAGALAWRRRGRLSS